MVARETLRVRYEETDRMGVAYYANYFVWFEVGRTAFFKELGVSYRELEERYECILPVIEAFCRYRKAVGYDDELVVESWLESVAKRGLTFGYRLLCGDKVVAEGFTKHVVVDNKGRVKSFPQEVYKLLKRTENGGNKT